MGSTDTIFHIYSRLFKNILTLSPVAVVNLFNGLFCTGYPIESTIAFHWSEVNDKEIHRVIADIVVTINDADQYHMKVQMRGDDDILFQLSEYTYPPTDRNPAVEKEITTFQLLEQSVEEINQKKLVCLIPFELLRLQKNIEKERSPKNLEALRNLIQNDIIPSIDGNLRAGTIMIQDAEKLRSYTHELYHHMYSCYDGMEALNELTDTYFMTDVELLMRRC